MSEKGLFLVDLADILKHASNPWLHGESWEVVTNATDEKQTKIGCGNKDKQDKRQRQTPHLTLPEAFRAPSKPDKQVCFESHHRGAQPGDPIVRNRQFGCAVDLSGGQHLVTDAGSFRGGDRETARREDTPGMGRTDLGRGETQRQELFPSPGRGCELCRVHEEEEDRLRLTLGTEFSQLCPGHGEVGTVPGPRTSSEGLDSSYDPTGQTRVGSSRSSGHGLGCRRRVEGHARLGSPNGDHILGKWVSPHQEDASSQRDLEEDVRGHAEGDDGPSESDPDADCHLAAGVESPTARGRCLDNSIEKSSYRDNEANGDDMTSMDTSLKQFFDQELSNLVEKIENQLEELAQHSTDVRTRHCAPRTDNSTERLDILEIYCYPDSSLTHVANQMGLRVRRFTLQDGDLRAPEGQAALWNIVRTQRPKHIWASPDCKFWGNFSRRNMGRSLKLRKYVLEGRKNERSNLCLCEELYLYQMEQGAHFHLEQPLGSEMLLQPELEQLRYGTLTTVFDMCAVGRLNWKGEPLQKRTVILTTSRIMHEALDCRYCKGGHDHRRIEGQVKHLGNWVPLSTYAAKYSAGFARAVTRAVQLSQSEVPLLRDELHISLDTNPVDIALVGEAIKRRRLISKQTVGEHVGEDMEQEEHRKKHLDQRLKDLFVELDKIPPRVGSVAIEKDSAVFHQIQSFCTFRLMHAEVCRGTERLRIPKPGTPVQDLEIRKTFSLSRATGRVEQVGEEEEWQKLSQRQRIRKGIPARLTLTAFGSRNPLGDIEPVVGPGKDHDTTMGDVGHEKRKWGGDESEREKRVRIGDLGRVDGEDSDLKVQGPVGEEDILGHPHRNLARHGPGFLNLSGEQKKWLSQVHHRLGHHRC